MLRRRGWRVRRVLVQAASRRSPVTISIRTRIHVGRKRQVSSKKRRPLWLRPATQALEVTLRYEYCLRQTGRCAMVDSTASVPRATPTTDRRSRHDVCHKLQVTGTKVSSFPPRGRDMSAGASCQEGTDMSVIRSGPIRSRLAGRGEGVQRGGRILVRTAFYLQSWAPVGKQLLQRSLCMASGVNDPCLPFTSQLRGRRVLCRRPTLRQPRPWRLQ